jgi:hypothetical protein
MERRISVTTVPGRKTAMLSFVLPADDAEDGLTHTVLIELDRPTLRMFANDILRVLDQAAQLEGPADRK